MRSRGGEGGGGSDIGVAKLRRDSAGGSGSRMSAHRREGGEGVGGGEGEGEEGMNSIMSRYVRSEYTNTHVSSISSLIVYSHTCIISNDSMETRNMAASAQTENVNETGICTTHTYVYMIHDIIDTCIHTYHYVLCIHTHHTVYICRILGLCGCHHAVVVELDRYIQRVLQL